MQLEEKLVEGPDEARAERQAREELLARDEEELPAPVTEAIEDASLKVRGQLLGAVRMILDGQTLDLSHLQLPEREMQGLVALQVAVEGKSHDLAQFVYASDRRDLLEQALGVLQPDLANADASTQRELRAQMEDLVHRVGDLRERLLDLEDAQDELMEARRKAEHESGAEAPGDKPKPSDPDAPRPPTTLTGPDRPEPAPAPTTLTGPDRPEAAPAPTTLTGPDRPEAAPAPTTLTGPDRPEAAPAPTTLTGPDRPEAAPAPTTLTGPDRPEAAPAPTTLTGPDRPEPARPPTTLMAPDDAGGEPTSTPGEAADGKAKRPWWRRPFG